MKKKHVCKNPNGCTCDKGGCTCGHDHDHNHDHDNEVTDTCTPPAIHNNGYDPDHPYRIPIQDFAPFGDKHDTAQPVIWPANYVGNLDGHVDYMASRLPETSRLLKYMGQTYMSSDSYVCTKDNKLGYGVSNPGSGRLMYGMEFGGSDDVPPVDTVLTFTENNGLRHAGMNENNELIDMGPVTNPVVIGPKSHPQALVVPMANIAAVAKAQDMLYNATMNHIEEQANQSSPRSEKRLPEKRIDSTCMHTLPMFAPVDDEDKLPF